MKRHSRAPIETPGQLRRAIAKLSSTSPITDRFSARWRRLGKRGGRQQEQKAVWYKTQHEHWLGWLREYDGPGAYGRTNWNRTAGFVYNHVVNPQMLVYLAEASKVPPALLTKATNRALAGKATMASMCGAVRRVLPWSVVEGALSKVLASISRRQVRKSSAPSAAKGCRGSPSMGTSGPKSVLYLTLHREFFDAIAAGTKRIEYRERTPHWRQRLEGRRYDLVHFRNGYAARAPEMWVEYRGLRRHGRGRTGYYAIWLGRVLKIRRWKRPRPNPRGTKA